MAVNRLFLVATMVVVLIFLVRQYDVDIVKTHTNGIKVVETPSSILLPTDLHTITNLSSIKVQKRPQSDVNIESVRNLANELSLERPSLNFGSSLSSSAEPLRSSMISSDGIGGRRSGRRGRGRRGKGGRQRGDGDENNGEEEVESFSDNRDNAKEYEYAQSLESSKVLQGREANLAKIRAKQGTILFTHIRRAGGTVLEDYVLKPFVKSQGGRGDYLCKEGLLGRYYKMSQSQLKPYAKELSASALQWRHCPFGLHSLLPSDGFIYITMLREPLARMVSWYAYCNKYSPNKCQAGKNFMSAGKPNDSPASKFYSSRLSLYKGGKAAFDKDHSPPTGTFHPNNLEYRLDDNYQTRMICGGKSHEHAIPIGEDVRECGLSNMENHYAFVAVTERYTESVCVLAAMINIPAKLKQVKNDKATTMTKKEPPDFRQNWGSYIEHDEVLYKEAHRRLDNSILKYPACRQ